MRRVLINPKRAPLELAEVIRRQLRAAKVVLVKTDALSQGRCEVVVNDEYRAIIDHIARNVAMALIGLDETDKEEP